jgi:hypothetical protein
LPPPATRLDSAAFAEPSGGGDVEPLDAAERAQRWLHRILEEQTSQPAPRAGGKWQSAYSYIGAQPKAERARVERLLRVELEAGRLTARMCTPAHVADHWHAYLAGQPPGPGAHRRSAPRGMSEVGTHEEFLQDAIAAANDNDAGEGE